MVRAKRAARTLGVALAWAVAWAPVAVVVGLGLIDRDNSMDEMWPPIGAYPGFLSGLAFGVVVALAEGGRGRAELAVARAAGWGALSGALVGLLPFAIATPRSAGAVALGSIAALSAISAAVSVLCARRLARKRTLANAQPPC